MTVTRARIRADRISDWETFHDEFNRVFQFPSFYGRNMNAWIDCMTSLDAPDDGMTGIHAETGRVLTIEIENASLLRDNCPEQYAALVECTAFVNWRRIEQGGSAVLALAYRI